MCIVQINNDQTIVLMYKYFDKTTNKTLTTYPFGFKKMFTHSFVK